MWGLLTPFQQTPYLQGKKGRDTLDDKVALELETMSSLFKTMSRHVKYF